MEIGYYYEVINSSWELVAIYFEKFKVTVGGLKLMVSTVFHSNRAISLSFELFQYNVWLAPYNFHWGRLRCGVLLGWTIEQELGKTETDILLTLFILLVNSVVLLSYVYIFFSTHEMGQSSWYLSSAEKRSGEHLVPLDCGLTCLACAPLQ